jgi:hypothetical protein
MKIRKFLIAAILFCGVCAECAGGGIDRRFFHYADFFTEYLKGR